MDGQTVKDVPEQITKLRERIEQSEVTLPKRLREIAQFVLQHPDQIALSTLSELTSTTDIPASAFVRFAKAFGFSGFKDLQEVFQLSVRQKWLSYETRLVKIAPQNGDMLMEAMAASAINSLIEFSDTFDSTLADEAIEKIMNASTLYLCGSGRSTAVVSYLEYMFTRLGIPNVVLSIAQNDARLQLRMATTDDAVLAVSFMPYRDVTKMVVDIAEGRQIPLICITDSQSGPLNKGSAILIEEQDVAGFRSISTTAIVAQYLAVETGRRLSLRKPKDRKQ